MPLTGEMLKAQGDATCREEKPAISPKFVSLGKTEAEVSPTGNETANKRKFTKAAHGLKTKDLVVIVELNGKVLTTSTIGESVAGLVLGGVYWVHEVSSSEFAIAYTKAAGESATEGEWIEYTAEVKTTTKFAKVVEITVTARKEVKYKALTGNNLTSEAEGTPVAEVESNNAGSVEVKWLMYFSEAAGGTLTRVDPAEEAKTLAKGDLYKINASKVLQTGFAL